MRSQKKDAVKRTKDAGLNDTHSTVFFTATFVNKVRTTVCADIGSAVTLMDDKMLSQIKKADPDVHI